MKNPYEVLRAKEQEVERIKKEIEALRTVARLLGEDSSADGKIDLRKVVDMP